MKKNIFEALAKGEVRRVEKPEDIKLHSKIYGEAAAYGLNLHQFLEILDPSPAGSPTTAFDRQLARFGIITRSDYERGVWASPAGYFFQDNQPESKILFPAYLQQQAMWSRLIVNDVNDLIASTRSISGTTYEGLAIDTTGLEAAKGLGFRVAERGRFPEVGISWSEFAHRTDKHGVALNFSDEFLRRASLEMVSSIVSRILAYDKDAMFNEAVDILVNGDSDGNAAAAVTTVATLGGNAGTLDYRSWLKWLALWRPFRPSICIARMDTVLDLIMLNKPSSTTTETLALINALKQGSVDGTVTIANGTEYFPPVTFRIVEDSAIAAKTILGVDKEFALERVVEVGSDSSEQERFITNQTSTLVVSVQDNFSKIWADATQVFYYGT